MLSGVSSEVFKVRSEGPRALGKQKGMWDRQFWSLGEKFKRTSEDEPSFCNAECGAVCRMPLFQGCLTDAVFTALL